MLKNARNVDNLPKPDGANGTTVTVRFVLPFTPSPFENARVEPSEYVIDLSSPGTEPWAGGVVHWQRALTSPPTLRSLTAGPTGAQSAAVKTEPEPAPPQEVPHPPLATSLRSAPIPTLVEKAREGNARAWEELVARFGGMIAATGRRYRLTPADVAELQQTTWLRLVENLHRIEQPERIGGWLATTARRESLQLLRRAGKYRSGADQMLANMPDRHLPEPDARPIAEEREVVLRAAWARLKPRCQELLSLLMTDDPMGYKDLSKLLEMPVGSIGPTRQRCLEHLRKLVEEEGMVALYDHRSLQGPAALRIKRAPIVRPTTSRNPSTSSSPSLGQGPAGAGVSRGALEPPKDDGASSRLPRPHH